MHLRQTGMEHCITTDRGSTLPKHSPVPKRLSRHPFLATLNVAHVHHRLGVSSNAVIRLVRPALRAEVLAYWESHLIAVAGNGIAA
jgi:hypothetical protein